MAFAVNTTTNASIVKTTYASEFGLDPTEESVVAGYVAKPYGSDKAGNTITLRKIKAVTAGKYTGSSGLPANLSTQTTANTEAAVTATVQYALSILEIDEPAATRLVEDAAYRTGIRKQLAAAVNTQPDSDLFALAPSLSSSESGADIDDAMLRSALKQLATNAKGKFRIGQTPVRLFIHPSQIDSVLGVSTIREYQIRGSAGSAPSGQMVNAYGISFAESGLVDATGGSYSNALILPDAWAIVYNIKPSPLPEQDDGIVTRIIFRAEYAVAEWFDSSGVKLVTT